MKNWCNGVEIMAGAAVDAESTTVRLGLPAVLRCGCQYKGEHVHKKVPGYACKVGAPGLRQQTLGGDGVLPHVVKRGLDGVAGVAGAGEGSRAHENECAGSRTSQRSHHQAERHHGGRCLGSPWRNTGELSSVEETER
jgi:hypothetical protein